MKSAPHVLMIGAAGRNVGKTEMACAVIRREAMAGSVMAAKITTVQESRGGCPRGGRGCGVCGSLEGMYCLTEETDRGTHTDTARMLEAGAQRVFWLRVLDEHLNEGISDLLSHVPLGTPLVCESNSARRVLDPGAFLVIRERGSLTIKASCARVLADADRVITFDGNDWDFPPDRCRFTEGRWTLPAPASGVVLTGGHSKRMGQNKSLLPYQAGTLLEHTVDQIRPYVEEVFLGADDSKAYSFLGLRVVPDERAGQGPLMGILSCVAAAQQERVLVTACDIPTLPPDLIRLMLRKSRDADIVLTLTTDGRDQPLPAVFSQAIVPAIRSILDRGGRRILDLCKAPGLRITRLALPSDHWYRNLNTPADYQEFIQQP